MTLAHRLKPTHLALMLHIGETGQLQRAAALSAMSQPAASRILSDVERQAGGPLFDRHPKGMVPTPLGEVLLRHASLILEGFEAMEADLRRAETGEAGHVRVGAVTGPAVGVLMPAVQAVRAAAPGIEMTIEVAPSVDLMRGLSEGRFDFTIGRLPPGYDGRDYHLHPARLEEVALLVRPEHPLAGQRGLPLGALLGADWVMQELGSPIRQAVEAAFTARGLEVPARITNSSSLLVALTLLEATDVIAPQTAEVVQLLSAGRIGARLVTLDLTDPIAVSPCFVIRPRHRRLSAAADRLLHAVFEAL
ncbi:LysR family transcriptional regulator [Marivivens marinus]|uniref:LysR family transcriptional regulator n=1 Tax=Marivivens marinus TaxID=3110173 RepID=UPI003B846D1F